MLSSRCNLSIDLFFSSFSLSLSPSLSIFAMVLQSLATNMELTLYSRRSQENRHVEILMSIHQIFVHVSHKILCNVRSFKISWKMRYIRSISLIVPTQYENIGSLPLSHSFSRSLPFSPPLSRLIK